jgi:hypothetical protein
MKCAEAALLTAVGVIVFSVAIWGCGRHECGRGRGFGIVAARGSLQAHVARGVVYNNKCNACALAPWQGFKFMFSGGSEVALYVADSAWTTAGDPKFS